MGCYDPVTEGKTDACTLADVLGREQRLKNPVRIFSGIPGPLSITENQTDRPFGATPALIDISPASPEERMAWSAFMTRLMATCAIW